MSKIISRRLFLGTALGFAAGRAIGEAPAASLRPVPRPGSTKRVFKSAEEIASGSGLTGEISYAVTDIRSGQLRESARAHAGLPPASVLKTITALYALDVLGAAHRFPTTVQALGAVKDGVVHGDLILSGGGDPTLDTDRLAELAATVKAKGIREVKGDFLVWGGFLPFARSIDTKQPDHVGYNPAVSGLNLNFNRVHFQWKRSGGAYQINLDARSEKYRPDVSFARMVIASRSTPVYTYADRGGRDNWTVARAALGGGGARWLPVRKPELYAGEVFQIFARSHGIVLKSPKVMAAAPGGTILGQVYSEPLASILRDMLKYSTNLTAEVVGLAATQARRGDVDGIISSASAMTDWLRETYDLSEQLHFVDHSGLGDRSRMTAADMVSVLREARRGGPIREMMKSIPMRDENRRILKGYPVQVDAKTGTLNFVSALAGYITPIDGGEMAFAIFSADTIRRDALSRIERERPEGGKLWNTRAKKMQQRLLQRWGHVFGNT